MSPESLLMWAVPGLLAVVLMVLVVRSAVRGREPAQAGLHETLTSDLQSLSVNSVAFSNEQAGLNAAPAPIQPSPQEPDEVSYLRHTLSTVFQHLGDQNSHVRAIIETVAEGIIVVNDQGCIDTFNPAAELLFGYTAKEALPPHSACRRTAHTSGLIGSIVLRGKMLWNQSPTRLSCSRPRRDRQL